MILQDAVQWSKIKSKINSSYFPDNILKHNKVYHNMIIFIRVNFGMWYRGFGIGIFYFGLDRKISSWFIFLGYPKFGLQIRLIILGFYGFLTIGIYSGFWRIPGIRDFLVSGFQSLGFGIFLNFGIFIPGIFAQSLGFKVSDLYNLIYNII